MCPICNKLTGEYKGWNCIGFAFAVWRHGGGLKNECNCTVLGDQSWEKLLRLSDVDAKKFAQQRVGLKDIEVIRNDGKPIPKFQLKTGDIIAYFVGDNFRHVMFYLGDGKISDCTSSCKTGVRYNKSMPKNIKVALRYTGK